MAEDTTPRDNVWSPSSCLPSRPLVSLGDGSHAPVLDYNMEVRSCLDARAHIPIAIPKEYIKAEWFLKPSPNIWDTLNDLTWEQILSEVKTVLSGVPGQYGIFINSHLLTGNNVHWDFEETPTGEPSVGGVVPTGGGSTKGGALNTGGSGGSTKGGATGGGSGGSTKGGGTNTLTLNGDDVLSIVTNINNGLVPIITGDLYGILHIEWIQEPEIPTPTFYIVEKYKVCTYAGNYGAGKTVHTHSLYPKERTTAYIRTYQKIEMVRSRAENVLDSFSESSAQSLENLLKNDVTKVKTTTQGSEFGQSFGVKVGATIPVKAVDVEVGANTSANQKSTYNQVRSNTVNTLTQAIDKHSSESAASRKVEVNTSTTETVLTEQEQTTTRIIENINSSRTLNFVFRQLHQAYLSITYLDNVSFMFTNGYPETLDTAEFQDLMRLLIKVCKTEAQAKEIHDKIMLELCNVIDYQYQSQAFIECRDLGMNSCCSDCMENPPTSHQEWISKKRNLSQTVEGIKVPGIILNVTKRIMPTDSVICEALLGQGEALDCYNMQLQQAAVDSVKLQNEQLRLENMRVQQAMDLLNLISDPTQKAELYKKIFGTCCNTPQNGCCCGNCGGNHTGNVTQ